MQSTCQKSKSGSIQRSFHLTMVQLKVKFSCRMYLKHGDKTLTPMVTANRAHQFIFNQDFKVAALQGQLEISIGVHLKTDKGNDILAGSFDGSKEHMADPKPKTVGICLVNCLDRTAKAFVQLRESESLKTPREDVLAGSQQRCTLKVKTHWSTNSEEIEDKRSEMSSPQDDKPRKRRLFLGDELTQPCGKGLRGSDFSIRTSQSTVDQMGPSIPKSRIKLTDNAKWTTREEDLELEVQELKTQLNQMSQSYDQKVTQIRHLKSELYEIQMKHNDIRYYTDEIEFQRLRAQQFFQTQKTMNQEKRIEAKKISELKRKVNQSTQRQSNHLDRFSSIKQLMEKDHSTEISLLKAQIQYYHLQAQKMHDEMKSIIFGSQNQKGDVFSSKEQGEIVQNPQNSALFHLQCIETKQSMQQLQETNSNLCNQLQTRTEELRHLHNQINQLKLGSNNHSDFDTTLKLESILREKDELISNLSQANEKLSSVNRRQKKKIHQLLSIHSAYVEKLEISMDKINGSSLTPKILESNLPKQNDNQDNKIKSSMTA